MVASDAEILEADPAKIALGTASPAEITEAKDDPEGPACQASLAAFQSALVFRNIFTAIVAVLAALTLIALAYCIFRVLDDKWDATGTLSAIGGVVTGTAAVYLGRERSKSINVLRKALEDVGTYCGKPVADEVG